MHDRPEIKQIANVADWLAKRGWAEANAGNLSVRLDSAHAAERRGNGASYPLDHAFPLLDGIAFLVTATRSRARDVSRDPEKAIGLVQVINKGNAARLKWGAGPPTSEFPAHLAVHAMCIEQRPDMRAILHTHPPYLIAMSHLPELREPGALNRALRKMHPEVGILVPDGVAGMDYRIPGSFELGFATRDALQRANVALWPMHGVVSLAPDLDTALDQVEIIEKAAMIYMLVLTTGQKPLGLTDEQVSQSREFWGIKDGS